MLFSLKHYFCFTDGQKVSSFCPFSLHSQTVIVMSLILLTEFGIQLLQKGSFLIVWIFLFSMLFKTFRICFLDLSLTWFYKGLCFAFKHFI